MTVLYCTVLYSYCTVVQVQLTLSCAKEFTYPRKLQKKRADLLTNNRATKTIYL